MKILHINDSTKVVGGVESYIEQLQTGLPFYGIDSQWIAIFQRDQYCWEVTKYGEGEMKYIGNEANVSNFVKDLIKSIDIICIHKLYSTVVLKLLIDLGIPIIRFVHSSILVCPGKEKFLRFSNLPCTKKYGSHCFFHIYTEGCASRHPKRVLDAWQYVNFELNYAVNEYKKIVVMSDYIRRGLIECDVEIDKIILNPYFTELNNGFQIKSQASTTKSLLFVGRITHSKGVKLLLDLLCKLLLSRNDIHLDLVGDGQQKTELVAYAEKLGISDKVSFHGWLSRDEVKQKMADSYLLVFPSIYPEAFGLVGIEAMALGKPVVAFDVGGVTIWLSNNETGFAVKLSEPQIFTKKVIQLLDDEFLYQSFSRRAKEIVKNEFTEEKHVNRLLNIFKMYYETVT